MIKNQATEIAVREQIASQALSAGAANGTSVDRLAAANKPYQFEAGKLVVDVGARTGTPTSFTVDAKIQDSADGSTWADVSGATMTQMTAAGIGTIDINVNALRQYVRAVVTPAFSGGSSPTVQVASVLLLLNSKKSPVA